MLPEVRPVTSKSLYMSRISLFSSGRQQTFTTPTNQLELEFNVNCSYPKPEQIRLFIALPVTEKLYVINDYRRRGQLELARAYDYIWDNLELD